MVQIWDLLLPLLAKGVVRDEQILTFWHDTLLIISPPGAKFTLTYKPRKGYVFLVWALTFGEPRDYATGDVLTTDDYGFWHRHSQIRWHWDPMVESLYMVDPYPLWIRVTEDDPHELEVYNKTDLTVIQDFSIWIFECSEEHWHIVRDYLRGVYNLFHILSQVEKMPILKAVERLKGKE